MAPDLARLALEVGVEGLEIFVGLAGLAGLGSISRFWNGPQRD